MDIWESGKLVLFIAFVVPGFVSLKCYETICLRPSRDASQQLIDAITYSCINYAILFYPIYEIEASDIKTTYPKIYIAFYAFVLLIAPLLWALAFRYARSKDFLQNILPHPINKPWDFVFSQRKSYWAIVILKNGTKIGGFFGGNSFASSSPATDQIYLEQNWKISEEGGFERIRKNSAGILIVSSEIESIEFFHFYHERRINERRQESS